MNNEYIRIIVDRSMDQAEEFAKYLKTQGYNAYVEPAGRHTHGNTVVETDEPIYEEYGSADEFISALWADFTNSYS